MKCKRCKKTYQENCEYWGSGRDIKVCPKCWAEMCKDYHWFIMDLIDGTELTIDEAKDVIEREDD